MASKSRRNQFVVFLSDEEKARLRELAAAAGTPASIVVRGLLAAEWKRQSELGIPRDTRASVRAPKRARSRRRTGAHAER